MKRIFALLVLLLATASVLTAGDDKVKEIFQKMVDLTGKGPYSVDLNAKMNVNQMGASMKMTMSGNMLIADPTHLRSNITASMQMPGNNPDMPTEMDMAMKQVFDGEVMWMEVEMKQMGMKQVMKMSLEAMKKQAEKAGLNMPGGGLMDPATMIQNLEKFLDMKIDKEADGKVYLKAEIKEEASKKLGLAGTGMGNFNMVIDKNDFFPMKVEMYMNDEPMMVMDMTNYKRVNKADIPEGSFSYTPPEGVQVMDLDAMMGAQQ